MTSINNIASSSTRTSSYSAKGFSGLASGMETEEIVEKMTADIQAKIDKVKQQQQKNTWKQDAYRSVISSLTNFESKYFSYASPSTNLLSSLLYNCSKKVPQGANASKISVTNTSSSSDAAYQVTSVKTLASKARYTGNCGIGGNTISTGDINFADRTVNVTAGKSMEITYNNVKYNVTIPEYGAIDPATQSMSMESLLNEALRQTPLSDGTHTLAEKLKFTRDGDKLKLETAYSGDTNSFKISEGDATTLAALGFSIGQSGSASSPIAAASDVNVVQTVPFSLDGKKLTFNLDGVSKTISFDTADSNAIMTAGDDTAKRTKMAELINSKLESSFGAGKITATAYKVDKAGNFLDAGGNIVPDEASAALDTKLNFVVKDSTSILKVSSTTTDTTGVSGIFGIEDGITNRLNNSKTLAELGFTPTVADADPTKNIYKIKINDKEFEFKGSDEISTVLNKINSDATAGVTITYLSSTNKFSIAAKEEGAMGKVAISDDATGDLAAKLFGTATAVTTNGTDLEMTIKYDGDATETTINRSSNSVSLDGVSFTVQGTFDNTTEAISFKSEVNTDNTIKVIKEMVEDYNKIIDSVNELVSTKSRKSNKRGESVYEPLTDAQKEEMTSEEIEKWEAKAKEGILFGDSALEQLASSLRFAFSSKVGDIGFGKEIGITTATAYSGNGKITIDEAKLKEALTNNPEKVKAMFTASAADAPNSAHPTLSGGFATRVKSLFESNAKSTGAYKGKLVQLAGLKNNATTDDNYIARQQKILSSKLTYLEDVLKKRQDRYQKQFTNLEMYISKMNSQSSWLSSATQ